MLAGAALGIPAVSAAQQPIELYVDLNVDPTKEKEMLHNFHTIFKPAAVKQAGYINVKMEKLRSALMGNAPANVNYRFVLTYASEEQRKVWVETAVHKKVWPTIENTLVSKDYQVLLFDIK